MGQPLMNLMSVVARRFSSSSKERVVAAAGETKAKRLMNPRSVAARRFSSSSEEVKEKAPVFITATTFGCFIYVCFESCKVYELMRRAEERSAGG